jgi:nicotinate-nucleotide adenylyltransferase
MRRAPAGWSRLLVGALVVVMLGASLAEARPGQSVQDLVLDVRHAVTQVRAIARSSLPRTEKARRAVRAVAGNLGIRRPAPVVYFTGTFDPIHEGHLEAARIARRELGAAEVMLVPNPPLGDKRPAALAERMEMMRESVEGYPGLVVADERVVEAVHRGGNAALVQALEESHPGARIYRASGSDSFLTGLEHGSVVASLQAGRREAVVPRPGHEMPSRLPAGVVVLSGSGMDVSSSSIRAAVRAGDPTRGLSSRVSRVIETHGLYQPRR